MLRTIIRDIWTSRELLAQLVQRDLRLRYRQAVMGFAWALLLPVLTIGAGLIVRMVVSQNLAADIRLSLGGIAIKSWAWAFFAGAMNFGTVSLLTNVQLVTKIYFPREVLPLSTIATQGVDSIIGFGVIFAAGYWLGFHWSWQLLWLPLLILILVLFTTGLVFLFACANLFFRDVKYILSVLLTFGIFFTPVLFEPAMFGGGRWSTLLMFNPLSPVLEALRIVMTDSGSLMEVVTGAKGAVLWTPWYLVYAGGLSVAFLLSGLVAFRRSAAYFAEFY
jgi:ABC-type polysaccharide/polyol phosphate export permease